MGHNFMNGDQVVFIEAVDRQDPPELPDYLPVVPAGTMGRIVATTRESVIVRIANPRNLRRNAFLQLYADDGRTPCCPITAIKRPHRPLRREHLPPDTTHRGKFNGQPGTDCQNQRIHEWKRRRFLFI